MEMMRLFESEKIQLDQNKLELLVQKLHENKEHNIAELFKNILIPKKIKQIIVKIQSHEKLNTIWKSNMLFFSKIKNILEKYIDFSDNNDPDVKKIIAELHVDHENGMKLIEKKCAHKFNEVKSDLYKDVEIRSKIFHEVYEEENNRNNHETLSSGSVAINLINKDKSNDELKSIKRLQTMAFGKESDDDEHQLFTEIVPLNYNALEQVIRQRLDSPSNTSLLDLMLPYILDKLKKGIDLKEICELEIFWDESSQVYGMDYKTMFVCMIERYQHHQLYIISLIKKLGIALPFVYQWIVNEKLILKMPLRAYSDCLAIDCPMVISLGSPLIGKSSLLNKIYSAQFMTNRARIINGGIDVLLSTSEFACGFTIFDIHDDAYEQKHLLNILFTMMPLESCWILLQSISVDATKAIINMLKSFSINDNQLICIVRDSKDQTKQQIEKLMQNRTEHVLSIRKIEENNAAFNSNLAVLREKLFKLTGIGHTAKKPDGIPPKTIDGNIYSEIEDRAVREQDKHIHIDIRGKSIREISLSIDKELKNIDAQMDNLQNNLFPHVELNNRIQAQERKKSELVEKELEEKQAELTKINQEIVRFSKEKASTKPSNLISRYNELFIEGSFHLISELDKRVSVAKSNNVSIISTKGRNCK